MTNLQLNQVSLSALATLSDNNHHLTRVVSFPDGHQKILGCLLPCDGTDSYAFTLGERAERIEITQGECDVRFVSQDGERSEYFREGQSFIATANGQFFITCGGVVQYIRHFEG